MRNKMPSERFRHTIGNQKPKIHRTQHGAGVPTTPRPYGNGAYAGCRSHADCPP